MTSSLDIIKRFSKSILSSCSKEGISCCTIEYVDGVATIHGWPINRVHMIGLQEFPRAVINERVGMALRNQAVAVFLTVMEDGVMIDKCSAVIKSE